MFVRLDIGRFQTRSPSDTLSKTTVSEESHITCVHISESPIKLNTSLLPHINSNSDAYCEVIMSVMYTYIAQADF